MWRMNKKYIVPLLFGILICSCVGCGRNQSDYIVNDSTEAAMETEAATKAETVEVEPDFETCDEAVLCEVVHGAECANVAEHTTEYLADTACASNSNENNKAVAEQTAANNRTANFNKSKAMEVLDLINAERSANGANQLIWDEGLYNYACVRAQQIAANFAHDNSPYGENIGYMPYIETANEIYMQYYNSPGHHQNYLNGMYVYGAVAVYEVDGVSYHVELFNATSDNTYGNIAPQHSEIEQEWGATTVASWTASNGIVFDILSDGNVAMHYGGYSDEEIEAAIAEFMNYMGYSY